MAHRHDLNILASMFASNFFGRKSSIKLCPGGAQVGVSAAGRTCHRDDMARLGIAWGDAVAWAQQHVQQDAVPADAGVVTAVCLGATEIAQRHRQQPQRRQVVASLASANPKAQAHMSR